MSVVEMCSDQLMEVVQEVAKVHGAPTHEVAASWVHRRNRFKLEITYPVIEKIVDVGQALPAPSLRVPILLSTLALLP